eukprot:scaffold170307_cov49-Prasinocladus_malaysianus.AAC.1
MLLKQSQPSHATTYTDTTTADDKTVPAAPPADDVDKPEQHVPPADDEPPTSYLKSNTNIMSAAAAVVADNSNVNKLKPNAERAIVLYFALDLHPFKTFSDPGLRHLLYVGAGLPPQRLTSDFFAKALELEEGLVKAKLKSVLQAQREFISWGPCCALQLDTWTEPSCPAYAYIV